MAIVYVAPTVKGTGDGSSAGNAMAWTSLNAAIIAAGASGATREVRMVTDYGPYYHTSTGQIASISAAPTQLVEVKGWSAAGNRADYARLVGNRTYPFVPPAPNNEDVWVPIGSDGNTGLICFNLNAGATNIRFSFLALDRLQGLFRVLGVTGPIHMADVVGNHCRFLASVESGGIKGTASQHAVFERLTLVGFSKYMVRLMGSSYVDFFDIYGDSLDQWGDGFTVGLAIGGNTSPTANDHITIDGFDFRNCHGWDYTVTTQKWTFAAAPGGAPTGGSMTVAVAGGTPVSVAYNATNAQLKQALATAGASAGLATRNIFVNGNVALPTGPVSLSIGGELFAQTPPSVAWDLSGLTGGTFTITTRNWAAPTVGYFQGDGITTEEFDRQIVIKNGRVANVGDGGLDLKSSDTLVDNVEINGAKRSFRVHPFDAANKGLAPILNRCASRNCTTPVYPVGWPLAGQVAPGSQCAVQANGNVTAVNLYHEDASPDTNVFHAESGGRITVMNSRVKRNGGSKLAFIEGLSAIETQLITETIAS